MSAGHSAANEAARNLLVAEQAEFVATTAREMHRRYSAAAQSEARLGELLGSLEEQGFSILSDRLWPGSQTANVDFVVVSPFGVVLIDAKAWGNVHLQDGRVFQGQTEVTDRFQALGNLGEYTRAQLAEVGIAPGELRVLGVFMGTRNLRGTAGGVDLVSENSVLDYLLGRGPRLRSTMVNKALATVEQIFLPMPGGSKPVELTMPDVVIPVTLAEALITIEEIESALHAGVSAKPIEDWMAYLHPDQARLARRSFNGPSRIRGAAGTGKTVVGLHRAAYIARTRPGKVLVTSYVRTLPAVLSSLMGRMAPEVSGRVEFTGVHAFAQKILSARGVPYTLDGTKAGNAFDEAWAKVGKDGALGRIDPRKDYWKEEVTGVIKGRGLTTFDEYVGLARVGRKRPLTAEGRHAVWELYTAYDSALRATGVCDFADLILLAEKSLRATPLEGYSAVIADEAQDLSCAMIRMLHALVGDAPDGLNLIGDGQQTIYPGGYTLSEANVSIAGRGVVLTKNYRNTMEIADFAATIVAGDEFMDIEGEASAADRTSEVVRHGSKPLVSRFSSRAVHDREFVQQVRSLLAAGTSAGDIGVLAQFKYAVTDVIATLREAGIPAVDLEDYDGHMSSSVKVGTIKRAKGLEFKQVLVVRTPAQLLDAASDQVEAAIAERRALDRRELYVAMTRARDGLWVGVA
jgi:hypothetical protein